MSAATPRQQQVIDEDGHCLVVAGPGSGKTATMVRKIKRLLEHPHNRIVAVTFTRDGAHELTARIGKAMGTSPTAKASLARLTVGTFHSLTLAHLRNAGQKISLASPQQQRALLARARDRFAKEIPRQDLQLAFEAIKCALHPERLPAFNSPWYQGYEAQLQRLELIDLYDVMRQAVQGFRAGTLPPLPCSHMIVDEAQDNDELQAAWVAAHSKAIVTMVGDDDQTIYEWRRAIGFPGMLAFHEARQARVVLLETNFRSHAEIVDAASHVIRHNNPFRHDKALNAHRGPGGCVTLVRTGSTLQSCASVCELVADSLIAVPNARPEQLPLGVPTGTWAVLARTNMLLDSVEGFLQRAGIRSVRNSGSMWDTAAAQASLMTLKAMLTGDATALDTSLHHFKVAPADIDATLEHCRSNVVEFLRGDAGLPASVKLERSDRMGAYRALAARLMDRLDDEQHSFDAIVRDLNKAVLDAMPSSALRYAAPVLDALRRRLSVLPGTRVRKLQMLLNDSAQKNTEHAVVLHTMHGCKGLEFDNVVIVGADQGEIPGEAVEAPPTAKLEPGTSTVASERRLFYVAMTRAKNRLFIAHSYDSPSMFLAELPARLPVLSLRGEGAVDSLREPAAA